MLRIENFDQGLAGIPEKILSTLIHQIMFVSCFTAGRQQPLLLVSVIYQSNNVELHTIISFGALKAFDRTEYNNLFIVLQKFSFGHALCLWIKILYTAAQASV